MGTGILVCGLNGAGKTTLGRTLAEKLKYDFIDSEDLYFSRAAGNYKYENPRTPAEAKKELLHKISVHENFVLASVKGDYGEELYPFIQYVVLLEAPKEIRMQRVRLRSFQKFGQRMLPGGDLQEQEERFFAFVESRAEDIVEEWVRCLSCPVIRVDGTRPVEENAALIVRRMGEPVQQ